MSENREEVLADFQACTGIEDVAEAIFHLDECDWDLLSAVNRVMPHETQTLPSEMDVDVEVLEEVRPTRNHSSLSDVSVIACDDSPPLPRPLSVSADVVPFPSTSSGKDNARMLQFHVNFKDKMSHLELRDTATVGDLKLLLAGQLSVPPCQQDLQGWVSEPRSDAATLASLKLPRENLLFLVVPDHLADKVFPTEDGDLVEKLSRTYVLQVVDEMTDKTHTLNYPGSKTVLDVKRDAHTFTDIPVRHQAWNGWPHAALRDERTTLACAGICYPLHTLAVRRAARDKRIVIDVLDSDNSSVEEFEDASETFTEDDIFVDVETKRIQPLNNVEDETAGCIHFADEFTNRYGGCHPEFFPGSLDEAVKEACLRPAKDVRMDS
uniref:Fas-associated factor 1/2-like UAS domain-containing protein n=1 Tax=Timema cristinae TaxID=61476 RepID=A0A7R9GWV1_TIMCR|nr:unnamed protein product [Timema cristinae]